MSETVITTVETLGSTKDDVNFENETLTATITYDGRESVQQVVVELDGKVYTKHQIEKLIKRMRYVDDLINEGES
jgi:hypothetical protein